MNKKHELIRRFRKVAWRVLYWKNNTTRPNQFFDGDDIAIVRNPPVTTHYKTLRALEDDIEREEQSA